jgi:hypothetical protein
MSFVTSLPLWVKKWLLFISNAQMGGACREAAV